jgi:hypothetical protein
MFNFLFCPTTGPLSTVKSTKKPFFEIICDDENDIDSIPALKKAPSASSPTTATVFSSSTMESNSIAPVKEDSLTATTGVTSPWNILEIFFSNEQDEIPSIETVPSFSFSPTSVSSQNHFSAPTPAPSPINFRQDSRSYEDMMDTFLLRHGEPECNQSLLEYSSATETSLEMLQLTTDVVEAHIDAEYQARRELIQQELDDIMNQCIKNGDLVEDEAIEAMGIAANQIAFLGSSEKPSIALSILRGPLLQVAAQHYFGDSNHFLVQYAPQLRSAIQEMKCNPIQEEQYYSGTDYEYVRRRQLGGNQENKEHDDNVAQKLVGLALSVVWGSLNTAGWVCNKILWTEEASASPSP